MRILYSFLSATFISIAIFFGMQQMISANNNIVKEKTKPIFLNYLRDKKDSQIKEEKRVKPKEPIKKIEPKKLDIVKTKMTKINQDVKIKPISIAKNNDLSSISSLNGAKISVDTGLFDANLLQTISRINPIYPRKAKLRNKEGFVQLQFHISQEGRVSNAVVIKADPKGYFENSAIRAINKWRFKPSHSEKDATITFNFRMTK